MRRFAHPIEMLIPASHRGHIHQLGFALVPGEVVICAFPGFWHTVVVEFVLTHTGGRPPAVADIAKPAMHAAARNVAT